jgi:hypothetical protein
LFPGLAVSAAAVGLVAVEALGNRLQCLQDVTKKRKENNNDLHFIWLIQLRISPPCIRHPYILSSFIIKGAFSRQGL